MLASITCCEICRRHGDCKFGDFRPRKKKKRKIKHQDHINIFLCMFILKSFFSSSFLHQDVILKHAEWHYKNLSVTVSSKLKCSHQSHDATSKVTTMLGFTKRNFSFKNKEVLSSLFNSLIRPHLKCAVQFWSLHHAIHILKFGVVQRTPVKSNYSLHNKSNEEKLASLILFSIQERFLHGKLIIKT